MLVVGAYAGDYDFPLPNPEITHPEYLRSWLQVEWYVRAQK